MSTRHNPDHALSPAIERLTHDITRESLEKHLGPARARAHLESVQERLGHGGSPALAVMCSIAVQLTRSLERGEAIAADAQTNMIVEIVSQLSAFVLWDANANDGGVSKRQPGAALAKAALAAANSDDTVFRISLCDGRRLGELLVKMSMLSIEQVEEALSIQRAKGIKLGEALVSLKLVTPEMVESLLRLQKQKRLAPKDNWSPGTEKDVRRKA